MRRTFRRLLMGICLHLLLSGFLLGLFTVYRRGYDRTHHEQIESASLSVSGSTATLTVLSQSVTVELPENRIAGQVLSFALADARLRLCAVLAAQFMDAT